MTLSNFINMLNKHCDNNSIYADLKVSGKISYNTLNKVLNIETFKDPIILSLPKEIDRQGKGYKANYTYDNKSYIFAKEDDDKYCVFWETFEKTVKNSKFEPVTDDLKKAIREKQNEEEKAKRLNLLLSNKDEEEPIKKMKTGWYVFEIDDEFIHENKDVINNIINIYANCNNEICGISYYTGNYGALSLTDKNKPKHSPLKLKSKYGKAKLSSNNMDSNNPLLPCNLLKSEDNLLQNAVAELINKNSFFKEGEDIYLFLSTAKELSNIQSLDFFSENSKEEDYLLYSKVIDQIKNLTQVNDLDTSEVYVVNISDFNDGRRVFVDSYYLSGNELIYNYNKNIDNMRIADYCISYKDVRYLYKSLDGKLPNLIKIMFYNETLSIQYINHLINNINKINYSKHFITMAGLFRFYLIEKGYKVMDCLDTNNSNVGYVLGRFFSVACYCCNKYYDRYDYKSYNDYIMKMLYHTEDCFNELINKKIKYWNKNKTKYIENMLTDIVSKITTVPKKLSSEDKVWFGIGYTLQNNYINENSKKK